MKRIDFFGAPAVGKSTVYNNILKDKKRKWLSPSEAHFKVIKPYIRKQGGLYRWKKQICNLTPASSALNEKIRKSIVQDSGRDLVLKGEWHDFLRFLIEILPSNISHAGRRFEMMERMLYWVYETLPVESFPSPLSVCYDWSWCQRALDREFFEITRDDKNNEKFYSLLPAPECAIHLTAPEEAIVERIFERMTDQQNPEHRNRNKDVILQRTRQSLEIADAGSKILKERGARVQTIRTDRDIQKVCSDVRSAISAV